MDQKRIGIIGAGISGLVTAKVFLSQRHSVTLFERDATIGGVWAPSRRYPGVRIQIPRDCYAFSDFRMPSDYPQLPSGEQMYDYLDAYARQFDLHPHVRLGTEICEILPRPDGRAGWRLRAREVASTREVASARETEQEFDFVVICNGVFCQPAIPEFPGRTEFEAAGGRLLHSSQLAQGDPFTGRDVVTVGFGKSAIDLAETALATARSSAIVCRRVLWKIPRRILGRLNSKYVTFTRFAEFWFPHPRMGRWRGFVHAWLAPLVDLYFQFSEWLISGQLGLRDPQFKPDYALRQSAACAGFAPPDDFKMMHDGRIKLHRGGVARLSASGIELDTGERVPAQTIVLATGYRLAFPFLGARERALLLDASGAPRLYRYLINPDIADLGFNGYNGYAACQLSSEVGANWLAGLVAGRISLPSRDAMQAALAEENELRRRLLAPHHGVGFYATPFTFGYFDDLLRDLGLPPADGHKSLLRRTFMPLDPGDYRDLLDRAARTGGG